MLTVPAVTGLAEHPRAVARQVDEHRAAITRRAGLEPAQLPGTNEIGQGHGHLRAHPLRQGLIGRGQMQMPFGHLGVRVSQGAACVSASSLVVATVAVTALGLAGVMPLRFTAEDTVIAGTTLPLVRLGASARRVATALAYQLGISGVARLRPSFASLGGLAEVMFAVVAAWLLLGERITVVQAVGASWCWPD